MPSSSATGPPRLGAQECVDDCPEDVVVVHAAAAEDETGGTAALSGAERYRAGLRASSTTTSRGCAASPPRARLAPDTADLFIREKFGFSRGKFKSSATGIVYDRAAIEARTRRGRADARCAAPARREEDPRGAARPRALRVRGRVGRARPAEPAGPLPSPR